MAYFYKFATTTACSEKKEEIKYIIKLPDLIADFSEQTMVLLTMIFLEVTNFGQKTLYTDGSLPKALMSLILTNMLQNNFIQIL